MKMKRLLAGICCAAMALGAFTGCQSTGGNDGYNVAIVQLVDNGAFTEMRDAFIQEMRDLGYGEDEMTFDVLNAQGDTSTLN
ncbi:MAG TPA: ABC transporter substrate-binding protein, partial [Candidatus Egerieicola pullicola]|nr:ABC transporter substrate-binding protein [Candidatus Egerieicola pullicola]